MEDFRTIGEILKAKREEKNYSVEEVTKLTNIPKKYVIALEANQFEKLPGRVHVSGFIRLYASFLGLEESFVLEVLDKQLKMEEKPPIEELTSIVKETNEHSSKKNYFITGIVLLVLIVSLIAVFRNRIFVTSSDSYSREEVKENNLLIKKGELATLKVRDKVIQVKLNELSGNIISLSFLDYHRNIILKSNEYLSFDVDKDGVFDVGMYIKAIENDRVELGINQIQEKRLIKDIFSIRVNRETNVVSMNIKLKIVNKTNHKVYLFIKTLTGEVEKELIDEIELDLISNSNLVIQSIGISDVSAVDILIDDEKLKFNTQLGSVGYIKFSIDTSSSDRKLKWEVIS